MESNYLEAILSEIIGKMPGVTAASYDKSGAYAPVNIYETREHIYLELSLAGFSPEDVKAELTGRTITIDTSHKPYEAFEESKVHAHQFGHTGHVRTIELLDGIDLDKVAITMEHGLLRIQLGRLAQTPRQLPIKETHDQYILDNDGA